MLDPKNKEKPDIKILDCSKNNKIYSNDCEHVPFEFTLPKCCKKADFKHKDKVIRITFAEKAI